jgi:hypothetical protein
LDAIGKSLDEKLDRVIANLDHRVKAWEEAASEH